MVVKTKFLWKFEKNCLEYSVETLLEPKAGFIVSALNNWFNINWRSDFRRLLLEVLAVIISEADLGLIRTFKFF